MECAGLKLIPKGLPLEHECQRIGDRDSGLLQPVALPVLRGWTIYFKDPDARAKAVRMGVQSAPSTTYWRTPRWRARASWSSA